METFFSQCFTAVRDWTGGWSRGKDTVYAGRTHFVVAFWVDKELEGGVEVAVGFAYGTDVIGGVYAVF